MESDPPLTKDERKALRKQEKQAKIATQSKQVGWRRLIKFGLGVGLVVLIGWWAYSRYIPVPAGEGVKPVNQVLETDWYQGNKAAAVVIVEYSDFQCPACRLYSPLIEQLTQLYPDQLAVVYRHFPLKEIHPRANLAAQAAEAAGKQGKFWEMNHLLFERQEEWAESGQASKIMMGYAQELGLNSDQFKQDLNSKAVKGLVKADYLSALANRLNGTPSFFVNGSRIENPQGLAAFQAVLEPLLPATDSATISE